MAVPPFDPAVLAPDPERRRVVLEVLAAGLAAVEPAAAVRRALGDQAGPVTVLALGKAAAAMVRGVAEACGVVTGVAVAPGPAEVPAGVELIVGAHPVPGRGSVAGARRLLEVAEAAGEGDTVLVLVSGGASALAEVPAPGLDLADLVRASELLLRSGAPIEEVNAVRKHLSAFKGGQLAEALAPARVVTLILSDVVGSPPAVIGSGPTVPDPTTFADALDVMERRALAAELPAVAARLRAGAAGELAETPKALPPARVEIVADGALAAAAAASAARERGQDGRVVSTALTGEAREVGARLATGSGPGVSIYAGETTVTVTGDGRGGRNQELALAAALVPQPPLVAALGTDGIDGPTPAAGGLTDAGTVARARAAGLDPAASLNRNDAYRVLEATSDLLVTGPTGTNVGDLTLVWR